MTESPAPPTPEAPADPVRACRVCGCTDDNACPPTCWWIAPDLCSQCTPAGAAPATVELLRIRPDLVNVSAYADAIDQIARWSA
jgi:hypothetical protein